MYRKFEQLMIRNNVSAYEVSKNTGIARSTFSEWKAGRLTPKADKIYKISEYFGVPMEYFMKEEK